MNKKKSFIFTLLMAIVLSFTPVHASTETEASSTPVTAIFNLHDEYQEETFYDENGVSVTLSVTHTPSNSRALSNGQYTIKGSSLGVSMTYQTSISNQKMARVYNGQYSFVFTTVTENRLVLASPVYSYYTVSGTNPFGKFTHTLTARITNGNLITSFN